MFSLVGKNVVTTARSSNKFACATGLHISNARLSLCYQTELFRASLSRCAPWVHKCDRSCLQLALAQRGPRNAQDCEVSLQPEPPCATSLHKRPRDGPGRAITPCKRSQGNRAFCRCHRFALYSPTIQQASRAGQESFCHLSRPPYRAGGHFIRYATRWPRFFRCSLSASYFRQSCEQSEKHSLLGFPSFVRS